MNTLIFDIETVPLDFDSSFDEAQREYLLRGSTSDEEREQRKGYGALNPLMGKVVCIGTLVHETKREARFILRRKHPRKSSSMKDTRSATKVLRMKYRC